MSVIFYLDGELVSAQKAREVYNEAAAFCIMRGYCSEDDAVAYWAAKARSEEARERIQEITCLEAGNLEVIIEQN
jgi:hypothetical protein